MTVSREAQERLRLVITENLRVQKGGAQPIPYIDVAGALTDIKARQNHTVFARRGCGKTLLLHHSATSLPHDIRVVYLNCEDFKNHTFPNVLLEILDALFAELDRHLSGWFGRKRRAREIIAQIRGQLRELKQQADERDEQIKVSESRSAEFKAGVNVEAAGVGSFDAGTGSTSKSEIERIYKRSDQKIQSLNMWLPRLKQQIRDLFAVSSKVKAVFIQVDDLYHLRRVDQPFVMDYLHRLCKDLPLYFKVATLRHASVLFAERGGQPTGAQERHDYQPVSIDFTFSDFGKTETQNRRILQAFGRQVDIDEAGIEEFFRGEGLRRLVMAGGGVPRDVLSLFLEVLQQVQDRMDPRIGKDDVRILSRGNFERRIEELKQDSEGQEQDRLLRGIYVIRRFCLDRKTNVFFVPEQMLQQHDNMRELLYRLLDYRIIHSLGGALTHKSQSGAYHAFMIDIGCYAHMRTLEGRFTELDIADRDAKEKMRSSPILSEGTLQELWGQAPPKVEQALLEDEPDERNAITPPPPR
jgi:hypothetical protein